MTAPLAGKRVGVTRSRAQASTLARLLEEVGAVPVELPVLTFRDPPSWDAFDAAVTAWAADPAHFDAVAFTSTNAVERAAARARALGIDLAALGATPTVAVIGAATAEQASAHGLTPNLLPERSTSEGLLAALASEGLDRGRWLIPRALVARGVLEAGLRAAGADVTIAPVYATAPPEDPEPLRATFRAGLDVLTFCSGSAVTYLRDALGGAWPSGIEEIAIASIGPMTTAACRDAGLEVAVEAPTARLGALVDAIATLNREHA